MASLYSLLIPDIIGNILIILDMIADIAFIVHLFKHDIKILFYVVLIVFIFATIFVNLLTAIGIEELGDDLRSPELRYLNDSYLFRKNHKTRLIYFASGLLGLLPLLLVCLSLQVVKRNHKYGNENSTLRLQQVLREGGPSAAVKEVQSVLESGTMIYFKCFYIFLNAILYTKNWPLLFGLSINILSFFFGLRNDYVTVNKWKPVGFIVALLNISLRMTILLIFADVTKSWLFFLVLATSAALIFIWGLLLLFEEQILPSKLRELVQDSKPKNFTENCMSSIMYTFFLAPIDLHTAISIIPFTCSSIIIACLSQTPIGLRILMPLAGTVGQVPPVFWWKIFKFGTK